MGFSFETLQKVLTFAHTIAEIAQLVEHQLPKLRAAGLNPVFRSKANRMMPNGHHFFCARTGPLQTCLHKGLDGQQKRLCAAQRFAFWSPRGQRTGMPEAKSRFGRECRRPNPASHRESRRPNPASHRGSRRYPRPTASSCNSPWARTPARRPSSKGYCPRRNKFVAPWAHTPPTTISSKGYRPR